MDANVENTINRALYHLRLVERALHGSGSWAIRIGNLTVPAERVIDESGVTFVADVPEHCWINRSPEMVLVEDGEDRLVRPVEPSDTGFVVRWGLRVLAPVA